MAVAIDRAEEVLFPDYMRWPAIISALLHIAVFIFATLGLPSLIKEMPEPEDMVMTVELVDFAEIAQTNQLDQPEERKDLVDPAPAPKPIYNKSDNVPELRR